MEFADIDRERSLARISQYALCRQANVHATTYQRLLKRPDSGQRQTIARLSEALRQLKAAAPASGEPGHG